MSNINEEKPNPEFSSIKITTNVPENRLLLYVKNDGNGVLSLQIVDITYLKEPVNLADIEIGEYYPENLRVDKTVHISGSLKSTSSSDELIEMYKSLTLMEDTLSDLKKNISNKLHR